MLRAFLGTLGRHAGTVLHQAGSQTWPAHARCMCQASSSMSSTETRTSSAILKEFQLNPEAAAKLVSSLPEVHRAHVVAALLEAEAAPGSGLYMKTLFKQADRNSDGTLCESEMELALRRHSLAMKDNRVHTPSRDELLRVFTASTLPFVGFGFLDNFIMISAGDYIDATLGSALLLSTMAAAGLGNLISDIAGIFCADAIEARARVYRYGAQPSLSAIQKRLPAVVWIKTAGAVIGITVGCLLGMIPLFFVSHSQGDHKHEPVALGTPAKSCASDAQ